MIQSFTIHLKPISWNILARQGRWKYKKVNDEWKDAAWKAIKESRLRPMTNFPIRINYHAKWRDKRVHDVDSLFVKGTNDMLVACKIIPDDNLKYVEMVTFSGEVGANNDELVVTIGSINEYTAL